MMIYICVVRNAGNFKHVAFTGGDNMFLGSEKEQLDGIKDYIRDKWSPEFQSLVVTGFVTAPATGYPFALL